MQPVCQLKGVMPGCERGGHSIVYSSSRCLASARIILGKATFLLCRQPQNSKIMMHLLCMILTSLS